MSCWFLIKNEKEIKFGSFKKKNKKLFIKNADVKWFKKSTLSEKLCKMY